MEKILRQQLSNIFYYRDGYRGIQNYKRNAIKHIHSDTNRREIYEKLKSIIVHSYKTSPYYFELWNTIGVKTEDLKCEEDIVKLPFLTKEIIQEQKQRMVSTLFKDKVGISYTGGSSGNPTSFFRNDECTSARIGRQLGILEKCGYHQGDRCGLIWGAHADLDLGTFNSNFKKKLRNIASGKKMLCCTVMNESNMDSYYKALKKFKPTVLYGYPNAMAEFARFIRGNNLERLRVKTIICTAENLNSVQRKTLFDVFGGEVFNLYCTREHGCIGFECSEHNGFHIDTGSVYVEIVRDDFHVPPDRGEIVITDLLNYGMPFIRYKIGDMGSLSNNICVCGCQLPLLKSFDGRVTDLLYKKDGSSVAGLMLLDMMMDVSAIKWFQIVQDSLSEIDVFLVVSQNYNNRIEQKLINEINMFFDNQTKINIKIVSEIQRNPNSGKFQEVVCNIKK